jgi:hypothetical protein
MVEGISVTGIKPTGFTLDYGAFAEVSVGSLTLNLGLRFDRMEKSLQLGGHRRVAGFVDVFNLLNANPEQNTNWSSGSSFLRPLDIVAPRLARVGVKLEW